MNLKQKPVPTEVAPHREWRAAFQEAIDTMEAEIDVRIDEKNVRRMKRSVAVLKTMLKAVPVQQESVAYDGTATEGGARYQADQHLRALLRYTEGFYGVAIKHGMKAGETANAVAHIEKSGKALHELVHVWSDVAQQRQAAPASAQPDIEPTKEISDSQRLDWVGRNQSAQHDSEKLEHWMTAWVCQGEVGNKDGASGKFLSRGNSYRECIDNFLSGDIVRID